MTGGFKAIINKIETIDAGATSTGIYIVEFCRLLNV